MTDKEIIIDGVDVSGCPFYFKADYFSCSGYRNTCNGHLNCSFKDLSRKTAECEKYEQALDSIVTTIKDLENQDIVTFPDFSLKENCKIIMGQCNKGYVDILDIISKAKDGKNEKI